MKTPHSSIVSEFWADVDYKLYCICNRLLALCLMVLMLPLIGCVALSVRLFLDKPVLFKQMRSGLHGRPFKIYKFRTLPNDKKDDVTKVGFFLRKFGLDELPQLFNIIKGDMHFVGPRPFVTRYLSYYSSSERTRLAVLPGITGWAQVHGRNNLSWEDKIKLDIWYIENHSLWLDIKIIFKTIALFFNSEKTGETATLPPLTLDHDRSIALHVFPSWPVYEPDEVEAAMQVLELGKVNDKIGNMGQQFEKEFASYVDSRYAIAVANGRIALERALQALDIGLGDEVIVPARIFFATASGVASCGAVPVFSDVDRNSQVVTAETVRAAITPQTKAIIVVHLAGWPCNMEAIMALAKAHHLKVIEDCSQAHGARYRNRSVGSKGDIGIFSFCQDKMLSTVGEGGIIVTSDPELESRMACRIPRLTELQAAVGRIQLKKLNAWVKRRQYLASIYRDCFSGCKGLTVPEPDPRLYHHAYDQFYLLIDDKKLKAGWSRDRLLATLSAENIPCSSGVCPEWYREQALTQYFPQASLPVASHLAQATITLPVYPTLQEIDVRFIAERVLSAVKEALSLTA